MEITSVNIHHNNFKESKVLASASVCFDGNFVVHRILLIDGEKGPYIQFPQIELKNKERKDICHPANTETRKKIFNAIYDAYKTIAAEKEGTSDANNTETGHEADTSEVNQQG